jgi:signal transduction histidine kinase/CheY-like chemotaxis protein
MLGYRWDEYVGRHIAEFHADQPVIESLLARLVAGDTLYDQPARLRCKDGSIKHVVIYSNGCFEDGRLRYTRCFTRDASERHQLAQAHLEREALLAELTKASRAKDELLAMLAHELRNPLAPIGAAAQLLGLASSNAEKVKQAAAIIARQVGHLTSLIDDLLDVARVTRGPIVLAREPLDFRRLLSYAIEHATPQMRARRHHLALYLPPDPANVLGDYKRLVQVVANILANAAKYTPEGGNIIVRLQVLPDEVVLEITDNGSGMTPELVARVFDLFAQAERSPDRSQGGLGLGLALVKTLVDMHGGTVRAESEGPGKGSTFTVRLPRSVSEPISGHGSTTGNEETSSSGQRLRVLVVDDNVDAAATLEMLLGASGHQVFTEHTADRAIERARCTSPHAFLLDIGLPDMDGLELARRLRAMPEAAGAVLIAVTGYGQEQDMQNSKAAGFDYHLVKPVDTAKLLTLLTQIRIT